MNVKNFFLLSCALCCTACGGNNNSEDSGKPEIPEVDDSQLAYHNPVIRIAAPDPTAMRASDGFYYLYATEDIRNLPIFRSKDMGNGRRSGPPLPMRLVRTSCPATRMSRNMPIFGRRRSVM